MNKSENSTDFLKRNRKRDEEVKSHLGINCPQVEITKDPFCLIQSIPSKRIEPFKQWLAQERMKALI